METKVFVHDFRRVYERRVVKKSEHGFLEVGDTLDLGIYELACQFLAFCPVYRHEHRSFFASLLVDDIAPVRIRSLRGEWDIIDQKRFLFLDRRTILPNRFSVRMLHACARFWLYLRSHFQFIFQYPNQ